MQLKIRILIKLILTFVLLFVQTPTSLAFLLSEVYYVSYSVHPMVFDYLYKIEIL